MFKKTLIAASVAATASFAAVGSTVSTTPATLGVEYAVGIQQVTAADVTITPERDYDSGDIITLEVTGATVATMTAAATPAPIVPTVTGVGNLLDNIEFLEYSGNKIKLLVTNPVAFGAGTAVTVSGVQLITTAAADEGEVKMSAVGTVATVEGPKTVDSSTAVTAITYAQQLDTSVSTAFDAVIDVNTARKEFVGGGTADTLVISNTEAAVSTGVTTTGATYKVWGDFSFLDADGDGELGGADDGAVTSTAGTATVAEDFMSVSVAQAAAFSTGTVGITVTGPADVVIPDQTFTAETKVSYTDPKGGATDLVATTLSESSAGAWTLNGAKAHIPFLPFGSAYSQSVTVSNTSTQTGGVDLVIYVGDDTVEMEGIATVGAEGVTDISAAIRNAVTSAGLSGPLSFDVIINAPENAIVVEALYYAKTDGDRLRTL
ncbi:hypothetical protein [Fluctibacter halophilus]|nr:hypothetical protein [Aestuariibacter halophilus]